VNHKRVYRLYVEEKLALRRKRGRKRRTVRQPLPGAVAANQVWSVDFMTDALSSGRRFRTLNIVDDYTRECLEAVKESNNALSFGTVQAH
jgi:putative transposase